MRSAGVHHSAICVRDLDTSLRFYGEGLGLRVLMDHEFDGDWPTLFGAASTRLRSVFLGDPARVDSGLVELVTFVPSGGELTPTIGADSPAPHAPPTAGFFLLSLFVDVDAALERLRRLGFLGSGHAGDIRRVEQPGPAGSVTMVTLRDPDGVLLELIDDHVPGDVPAGRVSVAPL